MPPELAGAPVSSPPTASITLTANWNTAAGSALQAAVPEDQGMALPADEADLRPPSPTVGHGLAPDRAAALFRAYDLMGRGWLSRTQMVAALSELSGMHGLGEKGFNQVLGQDPATSREARYSLQDLLAWYERIGLYQAKSARGERIRAMSAISEPPVGALGSLALRTVFSAYCRYAAGTSRLLMAQAEQETHGEQRMNAQQLIRLCQDLELLSAGGPDAQLYHAPLTFSAVGVVFAKCKQGTSRRLTYPQWLKALAALSDTAGRDLFAQITEHAVRMQPQLAELQAAADAEALQLQQAGVMRSMPHSRERGSAGGPGGAGLPRLRSSAEHGTLSLFRAPTSTASAGGGPATAQALLLSVSNTARVPAGPAHVPGRLMVLERAMMEDAAHLMGQAATQQQKPSSPSSSHAPGQHLARQSHGQLPPRSVTRMHSAGVLSSPTTLSSKPHMRVPEAWGEGMIGTKQSSSGHATDSVVNAPVAASQAPALSDAPMSNMPLADSDMVAHTARSSMSRGSSPPRPCTTGSPTRAARLARVSMVDTAGVATEIWKFQPARPEAWDEPPPWMAPVLQRLQYLEAREEARVVSDAELHADIVLRTQKWEQSERLVVSKNATLEARLLAIERRTADSDALLGGVKMQLEALQDLQDQVTALRNEVGEGVLAQVREEVAHLHDWVNGELSRLGEALGECSGGWQAALAMGRQSAQDQANKFSGRLDALTEVVGSAASAAEEAVRAGQQAGGLSPELVAHVESSINAMAEHLACELGAATAQQSAAVTEPMRAGIDRLHASHEALTRKLQEMADSLAAQQAETDQLHSEIGATKMLKSRSSKGDLAAAAEAAAAATVAAHEKNLVQVREELSVMDHKLEQYMDDLGEKLAELMTAHLDEGHSARHQAAVEAQLSAQAAEVSKQLAQLSVKQGMVDEELLALKAQLEQVSVAATSSVALERSSAPADQGGSDSAAIVGTLDAKLGAALQDITVRLEELAAAVEDLKHVAPAAAAALVTAPGGRSEEVVMQVTSRVAELEEAVGGFASALSGISSNTRSESEAIFATLEQVKDEVAALDARLAKVQMSGPGQSTAETAQAAVDAARQRFEEATAVLHQSVSALEDKVAELEGKVALAPPLLASTRWEASSAQLSHAVSGLEAKLSELQVRVSATLAVPAPVPATTKRPEDTLTAAYTAINEASRQWQTSSMQLTQSVAGLEAKLAQVEQQLASGLATPAASDPTLLQTLGSIEGQVAQLHEALGQADVAALAVSVQASAAQAAAAEAMRMASEATSQASALESRVQALASVAKPASASGGNSEKLGLLEAAVVQAASKLQELEAGMQALASAALDTVAQQHAASTAPNTVSIAFAQQLETLSGRLATLEAAATASATARPESAAVRGSNSREMSAVPVASDSGANASKRDLDTLRVKVTQMSNVMLDLQQKVATLGSGPATTGTATPAAAHTTSAPSFTGASQGAPALAALQMAQMQMVQQVGMQQAAIAQLSSKVAALEAKAAIGGGGGAMAAEVMQQQTASQLNLIQGAIVQLNGEVNTIKLTVPQLVSAIKGSSGTQESAAVLTSKVASGEYGPVLAALAEELQRCSVRQGVVESDMRITLTSLAKASDLSQLEMLLTTRTEKLEEAVEDLRVSVRGAVEGGAGTSFMGGDKGRGGPLVSRMTSAVGASLGGGQETPGGAASSAAAGTHRFATWDALKHAEGMLIKAQQQSKDEMMKMSNVITDLVQRVASSEDKLMQRLDGKEKILMRMAKELDDLKISMAAPPKQGASAPPPSAGADGGRANRLVQSKTAAKSHRYSMFDD